MTTPKDGSCSRVRFGAAGLVGMASLSAGGDALERFALIGPFEGLGHGAVKVIHEGFQFKLEISQRGEVATANHLAHQNAEPDFDLIHPRGVFGGVTKPNPMGGITQKAGAVLLTLEDSGSNSHFGFDRWFKETGGRG